MRPPIIDPLISIKAVNASLVELYSSLYIIHYTLFVCGKIRILLPFLSLVKSLKCALPTKVPSKSLHCWTVKWRLQAPSAASVFILTLPATGRETGECITGGLSTRRSLMSVGVLDRATKRVK